jgi:hypothetical protein
MNLTWPQWTLLGCVLASLLLMAIGAIRALGALAKTKVRARATQDLVNALDLPSASQNAARMNGAVAAMPALAQRANVAVASMNQAIQDLKLPEAMAALRAAATAVKLLFSGR